MKIFSCDFRTHLKFCMNSLSFCLSLAWPWRDHKSIKSKSTKRSKPETYLSRKKVNELQCAAQRKPNQKFLNENNRNCDDGPCEKERKRDRIRPFRRADDMYACVIYRLSDQIIIYGLYIFVLFHDLKHTGAHAHRENIHR